MTEPQAGGGLSTSRPVFSIVGATARLALAIAMTMAGYGGMGCGEGSSCEADACPCPDDGRLDDGRCCRGWTEAAGSACALRPLGMPTVISDPGAEHLSLRIDGRGLLVGSWVMTSMEAAEIVIAEEDEEGSTFTLHHPGEVLPGRSTRPELVVGNAARVLVAWMEQHGGGGTVYVAERDDDGAWTWPPADRPLSLPPTAQAPQPLIAPSGETLVVWNQGLDPGFGVAVATRAPGESGDFVRTVLADDILSPPISAAVAPEIAAARNGDAIVAWTQRNGGLPMVYLSERERLEGVFSPPGEDPFISPAGAPVESHPVRNPVPAIHDRGAAVVVWTQSDGNGAVPVYLAMRDGFGTWTLPQDLGDSFSVAAGQASETFAAFGPEGDLTVVWSQDRGDGPVIQLAHRTRLETWTFEGRAPLLVSTPAATARGPRLAYGPDGAAALVWTEQREGAWRVALRRREPDGTWMPIEIVSLSVEEDATDPTVTLGHDGRMLIGYLQGPPMARRIHVVETWRR